MPIDRLAIVDEFKDTVDFTDVNPYRVVVGIFSAALDVCDDKAVILNREQVRQIHDWLGAWLGR